MSAPPVVRDRPLQVVTLEEAEALRGSAADDGGHREAPAADGPPMWRTLADIPDDPPRPLLFDMLEPDGPTMPYGAPGVGKGMTGAYLVTEALRVEMKPLIYDPEGRPREWSRRVAGLGGDRSRVVYLAQADLGTKYAGRPLWEVAPVLRRIVRAAGADIVFVDSALPATGLGEERLRSDAQVPYLFVAGVESLGVPSVTFGHTPKGQPEGDPFGSFAWVAAMRLTWLGTRAEGDGHRVRWRPRKRNERGHIAGVLLTFEYDEGGRPVTVQREDDEQSTRDWLLNALVRGPRSVAELVEELVETMEEPPSAERIEGMRGRLRQALLRMSREGWVVKEGTTGRAVRWRLNLR